MIQFSEVKKAVDLVAKSVKMKEDFEKAVYGKCANIINMKKLRMRQLTSQSSAAGKGTVVKECELISREAVYMIHNNFVAIEIITPPFPFARHYCMAIFFSFFSLFLAFPLFPYFSHLLFLSFPFFLYFLFLSSPFLRFLQTSIISI